MLELGTQGFWSNYYYLLGAVFEHRAIEKNGDQRELSKTEFINLLKDCDILIIAPPKKAVDESKKKGGEEEKKDEPKVPERSFDKKAAEDAI